MAQSKNSVSILGIFVADLAFRAGRMPGIGETIAGVGAYAVRQQIAQRFFEPC